MIPIFDAEAVQAALSMPDAIEAVKWAYIAVSTGQVSQPPRLHVAHPTHTPEHNVTLVMPAFVAPSPDGRFASSLAVKTVSVYPANVAQGLPAILGGVLVLEPTTGAMRALLDGTSLTAIRTGAGSAAASAALARSEARTLSLLGTGGQAEKQLEGVCAVRPIERVFVHNRTPERARDFVARMRSRFDSAIEFLIAPTADDAVRQADILCTATGAAEALFAAEAVRPGTHINAIGSHRPDRCELPAALLARARLFCDQRAACLAEAGDYLQAIEQGLISAENIEAEIGQVLNGTHSGRQSEDEITVFKSVGLAAQDAVCGAFIAARYNSG